MPLFFDAINVGIGGFIDGFQKHIDVDTFLCNNSIAGHPGWYKSGKGVSIFTILGLLLIWGMGFWNETMQTLAWCFRLPSSLLSWDFPWEYGAQTANDVIKILHPILDLMQTMPAFVYLISCRTLFRAGNRSGSLCHHYFCHASRSASDQPGYQASTEECCRSFALFWCDTYAIIIQGTITAGIATIMTGINQTILMSLSMVVIAAMIAAGGLGEIVLKGITQMKIGLGFEGGIAVVILAIILDRITQGLGKQKKGK